jgi:hypothetical protein
VKGSLVIFQAHADDHRVLALIESRLKKAAAKFLRSLKTAEEFGGLMNNIDAARRYAAFGCPVLRQTRFNGLFANHRVMKPQKAAA